MTFRFAALGLDHRHIYEMSRGMREVGCAFAGYWTEGEPQPMEGFVKRYPDVPRVERIEDILEDDSIVLVLIAAPPADRARLSILAMKHGKDIMLDKPGCLTPDELAEVEATVSETGRIWSVNFSERFQVPSSTLADSLVADGTIGKVVHIQSQGPHRLNAPTRPEWFWDRRLYGGILGDIGTHQIDQFLHFARAETAEITRSAVGNFRTPEHPGFDDYGEMNLTAGDVQGYVRLDWYTPDAAPNWGDGRLTIVGTEGFIEVRKYMDIGGRDGTDHVFLVNGDTCERYDARDAGTPYFERFRDDIENRTETACPQRHTFEVMRLAMQAQTNAVRLGSLAG